MPTSPATTPIMEAAALVPLTNSPLPLGRRFLRVNSFDCSAVLAAEENCESSSTETCSGRAALRHRARGTAYLEPRSIACCGEMEAKLIYTGIRVKDMKKSIEFYTKVLGMR